MRFVVDLLSQPSRLTAKEVVTYFKKDVRSGSRNGHRTAVICAPIKDFAFVYKLKQGKLVLNVHYGEWNASGFPQHV